MDCLIHCEDHARHSLAVHNVLPYAVEIGFDKAFPYPIDRRNKIRLGDADTVGTNPDKVAILLVQGQVGVLRCSAADEEEAPEICDFCEKGAGDVAVGGVGVGDLAEEEEEEE